MVYIECHYNPLKSSCYMLGQAFKKTTTRMNQAYHAGVDDRAQKFSTKSYTFGQSIQSKIQDTCHTESDKITKKLLDTYDSKKDNIRHFKTSLRKHDSFKLKSERRPFYSKATTLPDLSRSNSTKSTSDTEATLCGTDNEDEDDDEEQDEWFDARSTVSGDDLSTLCSYELPNT